MDTANARSRLVILGVLVLGVLILVVGWFTVLKNAEELPIPPTTTSVSLQTPVIRPSFIAKGLESPTAIVATHDPADQRLFVLEQAGTIRIIDPTGQHNPSVFLDISKKVFIKDEMGLLGLTFHPEYTKNGYFYLHYIDKEQHTIIARYQVSADANTANPDSEKVILKLKQPYPNHNGGDIVFGPDGFLYIALGDGGGVGDQDDRGQNKDSLFGKILRIDVNNGDPYSVPTNNPLIGQPGAKPEIWAYGLRNPWRISFDKETGDLYIADVGQGEIEEVNFQKADSKGGENYGWRCYEGTHAFKLDNCSAPISYIPPVLEYDHEQDRCSVTGGYVYRGRRAPALAGKYFYADFCNGQIFYTTEETGVWAQNVAVETPYVISAFGQGSDGELYFADYGTGSIYKIQDIANTPSL